MAQDFRGRDKTAVQEGLKDSLLDQIADFERKRRLWEGGWRELQGKVNDVRELLNKRQEEQGELERVVEMKKLKGQEQLRHIEDLKNE